MQINLQGKNIELTEEIKDYVFKKVNTLEKFFSGMEAQADFEVLKTTNHHKAGEIFQASCKITAAGEVFYGESNDEDLHRSIDAVRETLFREITKNKDKRQTLYKRGASSVKKMLKGLSDRNPFTSKY
jgi:putative sigma-54 modulation protein